MIVICSLHLNSFYVSTLYMGLSDNAALQNHVMMFNHFSSVILRLWCRFERKVTLYSAHWQRAVSKLSSSLSLPCGLCACFKHPHFKGSYHSSESPPLYLPLSAAPSVISCSHPCADKDVSWYLADRCTIAHGLLAAWERANYPSFPRHFHLRLFLSLTRANGGLL